MKKETTTAWTIKSLWAKTDKQLEESKVGRAYESLLIQAEKDVADAKNALLDAQDRHEKAKMESKDNKNFSGIVSTKIAVLEAQKRYEIALDIYSECFGTKPKLS